MRAARMRLGLSLFFCAAAACTSHGGADDHPAPDRAATADLAAAPADAALGADGSTAPVDGGGDGDSGTGRCGDLACLPDSAVGKPLQARGTWTGSNRFYYSCVPGTPGRDTNGCCIGTDAIGNRPSAIEFELAPLPAPDRRLTLRVTSTEVEGFSRREATNQSGAPSAGPPFMISPFSLRTSLPYSIQGPLVAAWMPPRLVLSFHGEGTGTIGTGGCREQTTTISVTWELLVP